MVRPVKSTQPAPQGGEVSQKQKGSSSLHALKEAVKKFVIEGRGKELLGAGRVHFGPAPEEGAEILRVATSSLHRKKV